jgi:hypothetical protein
MGPVLWRRHSGLGLLRSDYRRCSPAVALIMAVGIASQDRQSLRFLQIQSGNELNPNWADWPRIKLHL